MVLQFGDFFVMKKTNYSFYVVTLLAILFLFKYGFQIKDRIDQKCHCHAAYDQFGYYSYLPAAFIFEDLSFKKEWKDKLQKQYCNISKLYQYTAPKNSDKTINQYYMGLSFLHLPFFTLADLWAKNSNYHRDGMSLPYQIGVLSTALIFVLIGLIFLKKLLLLFLSDLSVAITMVLLYVSTNLFIGIYWGELMPHLYLFTLNTVFLYFVLLYFYKSRKFKYLIFTAFILGLTIIIRPTQGTWVVVPLFLSYFRERQIFISLSLIYFSFMLVLFCPQLIYWKVYGGLWWIPNLHSESLVFYRPNIIDFLFSYRKGWLLYSPVFIFSFLGLYKSFFKDKSISLALFLVISINIYVLSCWEMWWYGAGFGSRVMMDGYGVMALGLGFFIHKLRDVKLSVKVISIGSMIFFSLLNIIQSIQYSKGIIPTDRVTKDHYWKVFGNISESSNYDKSLLIIDRGDLFWKEKIQDSTSWAFQKGYCIKSGELNLEIKNVMIEENKEFIEKYEYPFNDLFINDETQLEIRVKYKKVTNQPFYLAISMVGYSHYYTHYIKLESGKRFNMTRLNLPEIRHKKDKIKFYFWNPYRTIGIVEEVRIQYFTLVRTP